MTTRQPHIDRFDIDQGTSDAPPPCQTNAQQSAPGYVWNSTTQELIPILPKVHPTTERTRRSLWRHSAGGTERRHDD